MSYMVLVVSVSIWQTEIIRYQHLLQILVLCSVTFFVFRAVLNCWYQTHDPVIFSPHGEWLETSIDAQTDWKITDKSRVTSLVLFIHLISPVNDGLSKWCLIYKDQVSEQNFRRLCCAVIYQQQTTGND